jgi:glutamate 5-kinase
MSEAANQRRRVLVLKIGTSSLMGAEGPEPAVLGALAEVIRELVDAQYRVVLVTSGAVGTGRWRLNWKGRSRNIPEKQAAAAVGQGLLMHQYEQAFSQRGLVTAQLLLTRDDLADRTRYINVSNTLSVLLHAAVPVVPIINENDSVAVDELKFGDNDTLSALVAAVVDAEALYLLSDVDALYDADPRLEPAARPIAVVPAITPAIEALAGKAGTSLGTGGMVTKIQAARIATACGVPMTLLDGRAPERILAHLRGEVVGTTFVAAESRLEGRKRWLAFGGRVSGALTLDEGALTAVRLNGRSVLPIGVCAVAGAFEHGALVSLLGPDGVEVARGLCNYGSEELRRILGRHSQEVEAVLGYKHYDEVIHRNNLVRVL